MVRYSLSCMTLSFTTPRRFIPTRHEADPKPSTFETERLTIMSTNSSVSTREETPHETETTQISTTDVLRRRAQALINDASIDPQWRNIVRYALEINDPLLPDLMRRAAAGESLIDTTDFSQAPEATKIIQPEKRSRPWQT